MKRFTEAEKWQDTWFMELEPRFKLAWLWLLDNCDIAGVVEPNIRLMRFHIGADFDLSELFDAMGGRLEELKSRKWFIPRFIGFQQNTVELNPANKCHVGIIKRLEKEGIDLGQNEYLKERNKEAPAKDLQRSTSRGNSISKGKRGECERGNGDNRHWKIKTQLEVIDKRLTKLRGKSPGDHADLFNFLTEKEILEYKNLVGKRYDLEQELMNL